MLITIITYGLISFLSWLAIYVHSKLLNRETKKSTYLKIILFPAVDDSSKSTY